MEAAAGKKRMAVAAASSLLIVLLVLSGEPPRVTGQPPPQVTRGYRKCVRGCYIDCREDGGVSKALCKFMCKYNCPFIHREIEDVAAAASSAVAGGDGSCRKESKDDCQLMTMASFGRGTGTAATGGKVAAGGPAGADAAAACVHGCKGKATTGGRRLKGKRV